MFIYVGAPASVPGRIRGLMHVDSGVDVVTAANVDDYVASWKKLEAGQ
jgi:hypothetical protein